MNGGGDQVIDGKEAQEDEDFANLISDEKAMSIYKRLTSLASSS